MSKKATIKDLTGWEWRRVKRGGKLVLQRRRNTKLVGEYDTLDPSDLIKRASELAYEEAAFDLDHEEAMSDYDSCKFGIYLRGWSNATDEEIAKALAEVQERLDWQEKRDAEEIERLKKAHPELFKDSTEET